VNAPGDGLSMRPVSPDNVDELLALEVGPEQRGLVGSATKSIAQAAYEPGSRVLALYLGEKPVGLLLLYDARLDGERPANQLCVWRLLVDARFQRRGAGRRAMQWVLQEARRQGYASVGLSHQPLPGHAGPFYERLGFEYTGEQAEGEIKMVHRLEGL
jgi:GNAT superfamily N-acetyltransferase